MKNKKRYFYFALIFIICMISISVVSAADDSTDDISADDNQEIILEEDINQDQLTSTDENEKISSEDNTKEKLDDSSDKELKETNKVSEKAKIATKSSSKKTSTFKTVSKGSKDKAMVKKIQKALKKNGYYIRFKGHYLKVDGWYGPCTFRSVKQFQKAKKLKVTGKVDEKTAEKLKIVDNTNAKIKLYCKKTFITDYNSGKSFTAKVTNKSTGKGIDTVFRVDYSKKGFKNHEYYYTGDDGINYITPDDLKVGTYKAKVSSADYKVKANPVTKTIKVVKTSIRLKANDASVDSNQNLKLKVKLLFKNNANVNEGKVKFTVDGKSYTVKVKNGVATKTIKANNIKSNKYQVAFLGTKNIKVKSATGKIA